MQYHRPVNHQAISIWRVLGAAFASLCLTLVFAPAALADIVVVGSGNPPVFSLFSVPATVSMTSSNSLTFSMLDADKQRDTAFLEMCLVKQNTAIVGACPAATGTEATSAKFLVTRAGSTVSNPFPAPTITPATTGYAATAVTVPTTSSEMNNSTTAFAYSYTFTMSKVAGSGTWQARVQGTDFQTPTANVVNANTTFTVPSYSGFATARTAITFPMTGLDTTAAWVTTNQTGVGAQNYFTNHASTSISYSAPATWTGIDSDNTLTLENSGDFTGKSNTVALNVGTSDLGTALTDGIRVGSSSTAAVTDIAANTLVAGTTSTFHYRLHGSAIHNPIDSYSFTVTQTIT